MSSAIVADFFIVNSRDCPISFAKPTQNSQQPCGNCVNLYLKFIENTTAAREPEQFCPGCTGCGCGYIDYGSTEVTYVNNGEEACCCECCCTGIYRSEFGEDRAKTSDVKYVAVEYLNKHGMKRDLSVRKVVQLINGDKLQHAAITMAHNNAQQKNVATSENINVEMGPDSDMKPLVNSQVLSYESNTNLGAAQPRVCINCGAARTTDGQFCSHCGTRF